MRRAFVAASIACCSIGLAATRCSVYTTALLTEGTPAPDGGSGLGFWSGPGDQGCYSAKYPTDADRPAPQSAPALPPIYVAIRSMRFGAQEVDGGVSTTAWKDIGFDLDDTCTGSDTCLGDGGDPVVSCKSTGAGVPYDGDYCRDNTFGRLEVTASSIPELGGKYGLNDDAFNCALCVGDYNFIIKFSDYNGTAEDDHVRVDLYPSPGLDTPLPWNCTNGEWKNHPCITPDQALNIQDSHTTQSGPDLADSDISDPNAFVHEGYIVITLPPNTQFAFPGKRSGVATAYPVEFEEGIVSGHFSKAQDGTWALDDGIIAGRSSAQAMVTGLRQIGLCESDPNYALINNFLTANLDVLADGGKDPNATCDGLSFGIGFTAGQQSAGKLVHVDPLVECEGPDFDGGTDGGMVTDSGTDSGDELDSGVVDAGDD